MVTCVPLTGVRQSRKAAWKRGGAGWQGNSLFERVKQALEIAGTRFRGAVVCWESGEG